MTNQQNILGPKGDILTIGFISKRVAETSREASKTPSPNSDHLTVKEIEHYCQGKIVRATLQRLQRPPADVHRLAAWVKEKAKSIFLLLVYNEELQSIETLRQSGLTDANLPISVNYDDDDNIVVLDRSNRPCRLFTGWSQARVNAFASHQWLFMALPFLDDPFENNFQEKQCLDFRALSSKSDRGGFGRVSLVEAPLSHQDGGLKYAAVAVKYVISPFDEADPVKFYNKERETLETMRRLSHPHLIKAHAAFQRGEDRGFIFPWADGGNLLSVWDKAYTNLSDQGLLIWALTQMTGLCDGIDKLHATNTRHGDLKPANILCFSPDSSGRGKLKVADVGLAKYHREYTDRRLYPTTTKYASWRYAPPEAAEIPRPTYSLRYDMWCFGCVLLDFLVWLTLGPQQLDKYFKEYKDKNGDDVPFWEGDKMKVSRTTIKWMQEVSQALKMAPSQDPLLRPLLDLIQDRLLRITVDNRVYSQEALRRMKEILSQGIQYPPFHINPSLQSPVKSRTNDIVKYDFVAFSKTNNYVG